MSTYGRTNLTTLFTSFRIPTYYKNSKLLKSTNKLKARFKTLSRLNYQGFRDKSFDYLGADLVVNKKPGLLLYRLFMTIATQNVKLHIRIHPSTRHFFMDQRFQNTLIFNPTKLFRRWQDFYHLLFNLFFYEIDMLYFGNHLLKKQILSLNWLASNRIQHLWSYAQPYLYQRPNALDSEAGWVFQYLTTLNFNITFVFDGIFHRITLHYLHSWGFYNTRSI